MNTQCFADLADHPGDPFRIIFFIEVKKDHLHPVIPKGAAYFLMDPFVSVQSQLPVFEGYIYENGVARCSLSHFKPGKDLRCPVQRIDKTAMALHKDAYFATGLTFCLLDSSYDMLVLGSSEQLFSGKKRNMQDKRFNGQLD